jgi:hypothetical protein
MTSGGNEPETLASAWAKYEPLNTSLLRYLKTSEAEFADLIQALDACWSMAEKMQKATAQLSEHTAAASESQDLIRESMLEACAVFKEFLLQIQKVRRQLTGTARETGGLLDTARHLQENIAPLTHIAFHFRLEASRLSPTDSASVVKAYEEMRHVVRFMKQADDSQQSALLTILGKLSAATRLVEQTCASYAVKAAESERKVVCHLDLISIVPRSLLRVQNKASALGTVLANSIGEAVKALQGHDAIRQRLEHILGALADVRKNNDQAGEHPNDPGHALLLQRQQAKCLLEMVVNTGDRIERELNSVIGCAQAIADDGETGASGDSQVAGFEEAVDHLGSLSAEVAGLLAGEAKVGNFVVTQIDPIREMLNANSRELEVVSRSMKRLALNVLVDAHKIPSAQGLGVLGVWTAEASDDVLKLASDQNERFAQLGTTLQSQAGVIVADVQKVESCRVALMAQPVTDSLRSSRRTEYIVVSRLCGEAGQLQKKTEVLLQSLQFVDEARRLLDELDLSIGLLLTLYPKSDKPFDLNAASAGYTMQEQHDAHALVAGGAAETLASLSRPGEGQEYGANVELF